MTRVLRMTRLGGALLALVLLLQPVPPSACAAAAGHSDVGSVAPPGVDTGYVVIDRQAGEITAHHDAHQQFRSASLVKLLIALDYLIRLGPDAPIPERDRQLLQAMLRSSDNDAASKLWVANGWDTIVERMVAKLDLADTRPPKDRGMWGYTVTSAADIATVYRYMLTQAHPRFRDFILHNLRAATRCATDGRDQFFGIPRATTRAFAVKQGWSGFGPPRDGGRCTGSAVDASAPTARSHNGLAIDRPLLATSGTIGADHERIVVVFALYPKNTPWDRATETITDITRTLVDLERETDL